MSNGYNDFGEQQPMEYVPNTSAGTFYTSLKSMSLQDWGIIIALAGIAFIGWKLIAMDEAEEEYEDDED
jgi:hypothetical protein